MSTGFQQHVTRAEALGEEAVACWAVYVFEVAEAGLAQENSVAFRLRTIAASGLLFGKSI